jgi:hypothetical protein
MQLVNDTWELTSLRVLENPVSQTTLVPDVATFTVQGAGSGTMSYQWRKDGQPLTDGGRIAGATSPNLAISPTWMSDSGSYDVVVTNDCGSVTSNPATLTVTADLGDLNCDGTVDFGDINPFVLALTNGAGYAAAYPNCDRDLADCNQDGYVDFGDINPFVEILSGGS